MKLAIQLAQLAIRLAQLAIQLAQLAIRLAQLAIRLAQLWSKLANSRAERLTSDGYSRWTSCWLIFFGLSASTRKLTLSSGLHSSPQVKQSQKTKPDSG